MLGLAGVSREPERRSTSALLLAAIGCLGIVTQLVLLRELMAADGGNEFSAGITVAAWILCEALGAWVAGNARPSLVVHPSSSLAAISILFSIAAVPAAVLIRPALGVLAGEVLSIPLLLLATFAVVFLPAASHGALFVTAAGHRPQGIGSAYIWEGIGTVLAGFICFFLLNRLPAVAAVALSALPLLAAEFADQRSARTTGTIWTSGLAALVSLAALALGLPVAKLAWGAAWKGQQVVAVANSPYGKTVRLKREGQQFVLYDGLPVLTAPPTPTERIEETSLLPVLSLPAPRRVLVLGSDLTIPTELARFRPDLDVVTAQLDPLLARTSLAAISPDFASIAHHPSLIIADPVSFLRTAPHPFDCIILTDGAPASLASSRLYSAEFYRLCRARLAPDGLLASAGPGNPSALAPDVSRLLSTRVRTLEAAFEHILPVAADFPLILASARPLQLEPESIAGRLAALSVRPTLLDSGYILDLLDPFRQHPFVSELQSGAARARVSTAAHPRELFLNMVRENRLASPGFGALYARLGSASLEAGSTLMILLVGAVLLVVGAVGARARGRRFGINLAIMTSGFGGAAISSLLLFVWQERFGSAFSGVSLLIAVFMLGTVAGGTLGSSRPAIRIAGKPALAALFSASDLTLVAAAATAVLLLRGGAHWLFLLVNCLAGVCLGLQFAVAGNTATTGLAPARRTVGVLAALDLAGGSIGGILTALVVVPAFGIATAALLAGTVKTASALVQLAGTRSRRV
jgi:spermidine synthase